MIKCNLGFCNTNGSHDLIDKATDMKNAPPPKGPKSHLEITLYYRGKMITWISYNEKKPKDEIK